MNNILSGHTRSSTGFGVRLVLYGRNTAPVIERQVVTARVRGNRVAADNGGVGANHGLLADAGFSDRLATGQLVGSMFADVHDNTFTVASARIGVSTMRIQAVLGQTALWRTFTPLDRGTLVVDSDVTYPGDFRVDHPATDPLSGATLSGTVCATHANCSTATYRGSALPGHCNPTSLVCECLAGLTDVAGTCTAPTAPDNVVVINGAVVPPGTTLP